VKISATHDEPTRSWRLWLRRISIGLALVVLLLAAAAWQFLLRHSGDLEDFSAFLTDERAKHLEDGSIEVTFLGTSTLLVDDGTRQILIDAFLTPVGLLDSLFNLGVSTDTEVVDEALDRAGATRVEAIFVTHSHHDHAFDVAYIANRTGATVYGSESTLNIARGGDVPEDQLVVLTPDEAITVGGFTVRAITSRHSPSPFPIEGTIDVPLEQPAGIRDYKEGGVYDFLVTTSRTSLLVKGSANWVPGALDDVRADALFLGVGTLDKRSASFREGFFEATIDTVQPDVVVPTHWNDFFSPVKKPLPLQRKAVDDSPATFEAVAERAQAQGAEMKVLDAFSSIVVPQP